MKRTQVQRDKSMAWAYLAAAAVFEIMFALSMKYADGFTRVLPTVVTALAVVGGIGFLTIALKTLPVSVAYPIWTAVGTLGTVILGFVLLNETLTLTKLLSALAIIGGVAGLKMTSA
jgi:quaternary ammonium compound-resistance protein SugE